MIIKVHESLKSSSKDAFVCYSNPVVQVKAVDSGALQMLLTLLASSQPLRVKKKVDDEDDCGY